MKIDCPYCGRENDSHAPTDDPEDIPEDGDVSICWGCLNLSIFTEGGSIRPTSPEEDADLRSKPDIQDALMVLSKSPTPSAAADVLQHAHQWHPEQFRTNTGEEND